MKLPLKKLVKHPTIHIIIFLLFVAPPPGVHSNEPYASILPSLLSQTDSYPGRIQKKGKYTLVGRATFPNALFPVVCPSMHHLPMLQLICGIYLPGLTIGQDQEYH